MAVMLIMLRCGPASCWCTETSYVNCWARASRRATRSFPQECISGMARSSVKWRWPKASKPGTSAKPSGVARQKRKRERRLPDQEKDRSEEIVGDEIGEL